MTARVPFAPPPLFPPNTEQKFTSASVVFKFLPDGPHTGRMAGGPQLASAGTVITEASLLSMKHLNSAPWAALVLSLAFASFHPACLAGRTVSFILATLGRGREGRGERRRWEKDSLARVGPAQRKEETVLSHLKD